MSKEKDIQDLKERIISFPSFSDEEKKDLLSQIESGKLSDFNTGYPSIDRPWLKYHSGEYSEPEIKKTVYQEVRDNNVDQPRTTALQFFMSKISFDKMQKNIEKAAASFVEYGVEKGDYVTIVSAGIPETVYSFYGLSKIGAVANMMAYYFDEEDMAKRIDECESKLLIVMDEFYPQIESSIKKTNIKNIVIIPTLNSSILNVLSKKVKLTQNNQILWNGFLKDGVNRKNVEEVPYEDEMPLTMVYSSGTTGSSKSILLTNDSFQNSVYSYRKSGVDVGRGFKFYQIIPPWYSTGLSTSIHLPLASGSAVFMDPRFERDVFVKNIIKYKPNYAVAPTSMYEGFLDEKLVGNKDLSHLKYPFEGGEPLRKETADKIEKVFSDHGCQSKLLVGYGQCECGATITTETPFTNHEEGNVGIPLPGLNIMIVDDNKNELSYGNRGEILVDTPCGMLEYFNNEEATNNFFYKIGNKKWYCTGDIGKMDSDGNLFVEGRASDFSIVNGKKVYNFDIENGIMKSSKVKMCDVIENSGLLTVHIVFNDDVLDEDIYEELYNIQQNIYEEIKDIDLVPYQFKIRKEFPYAKSGKRDIEKMKHEKDGFIIIDSYSPEKKANKKVLKK